MLSRIRNELAIEIVFVIACFVLAIGLNLKVVLAIVVTCFKFAIPDFVTAYLVVRHDPSRSHGWGLAFLFLATGMARASQFAFMAFLFAACIIVPIMAGLGMGNLAALGMGTGVCCALGFLISVFPLTAVAAAISYFAKTKLAFASGLTALRRASTELKRSSIQLGVAKSLKSLSVISGISLAAALTSTLLWVPDWAQSRAVGVLFLVAVFVLPFFWIFVFSQITVPMDSEV